MWSSEWLFATSIRWSTGPGGWGQVVIELPAGPNWNQAIFCRPSQVALHLVVPVITLFTGVLSELFCSFHPKKLPVHSNKRVIDPSSLNTLLSFINPYLVGRLQSSRNRCLAALREELTLYETFPKWAHLPPSATLQKPPSASGLCTHQASVPTPLLVSKPLTLKLDSNPWLNQHPKAVTRSTRAKFP